MQRGKIPSRDIAEKHIFKKIVPVNHHWSQFHKVKHIRGVIGDHVVDHDELITIHRFRASTSSTRHVRLWNVRQSWNWRLFHSSGLNTGENWGPTSRSAHVFDWLLVSWVSRRNNLTKEKLCRIFYRNNKICAKICSFITRELRRLSNGNVCLRKSSSSSSSAQANFLSSLASNFLRKMVATSTFAMRRNL